MSDDEMSGTDMTTTKWRCYWLLSFASINDFHVVVEAPSLAKTLANDSTHRCGWLAQRAILPAGCGGVIGNFTQKLRIFQ